MSIYNMQVVCITCDGAAPNHKFFKLHTCADDVKYNVVYNTKNIYAQDGRYISFMSDVPHLIKIVKNCWLGSRVDGPHYMQVRTYVHMYIRMHYYIYY